MKNEYELIEHVSIKNMNVFIVELKYRTPHYHNDIEIGLVIKGEATIKKGLHSSVFCQNDIYLLNPFEVHELICKDHGAIILSIQLSPNLFSEYYPSIRSIRFMDFGLKSGPSMNSYNKIHNDILSLACCYFEHHPLFEFRTIIHANQIMANLLEGLQIKIVSETEHRSLYARMNRLQRILNYIDEHYRRKLLLQEIADNENLSLTYMSHFIKDMIGMPYQSYLNSVRLDYALHLIDSTSQTLLDVALECGFSDIRYLNRFFYERYGCTPKEYRKNKQQKKNEDKVHTATFQSILSSDESLILLAEYRGL